MATRRTSHSHKSRTRHTRRKHRTLRKHRTHRSRRGGAGNGLNPNAKPFSRLRRNAPAFVTARRTNGLNPSAAPFQTSRFMPSVNAPAFIPAGHNNGALSNGNEAAAEYNRRSNGTIMVPSNGTVARMEYNSRTQGATIMKPYNGVFNRR